MFYVVVYDISDNGRRQKIANLLEGYGQRVQFSVFECWLSPRQYGDLQKRLGRIFQEDQGDSLRFYPLSGHTLGQVEVWGEPPLSLAPGSIIV